MQPLAELPRTWSIEDVQRMLADDTRPAPLRDRRRSPRREPVPAPRHELVVSRLIRALAMQLPSGHEVVGALGIAPGRSYLVPDLVVAPTATLHSRLLPLAAQNVLLAVEVVSPASRTTDRITKPAQYAAAGISGYWRVETDPEPALTAYALDPGAAGYTELGTWNRGQTATIERPFAAHVVVGDLFPTLS